MAQLQLQPPAQFDFKNPDDWPRWKRRFEQFRIASGMADEAPTKQISTLLYCLGEEAEAVLASTNASADDRKVYATVLAKFDSFFQVRKNVIFERARFNRRCQREGESAEHFIMALYALAENCEYGALRDEMIRDRLVVGIRNSNLSERLQLDAELTLDKAKKATRQREAVHEQQQTLNAPTDPSSVAALQPGRERRQPRTGGGKRAGDKRAGKWRHTPSSGTRTCTHCGREPHPREKCPARDAICHCCNKKGHWGAVCRSKTVAASVEAKPTAGASPIDVAFLDNVTAVDDIAPLRSHTAWFANIQLCGCETPFKLDTGAEVTAITTKTHQQLQQPTLNTPDRILHGPSKQPLKVLGQFEGKFTHKGRESQQQVYVVDELTTNLLGLPAITALHLAARIEETHTETDITKHFPKVFKGLGNLGEEFVIKLKPDATPYALFTPRHVALPLRPQVERELTRMESMGVISKVNEPTPWCAGMVVVPKKSGSVRICVDLKPLNESVLREVHPLPKVDETLAQLSGAKVFSKLDANSGFWQIPLEKSSRLLTTFITPTGRYCFNKLPFGISSAPEHFQKLMSAILSGLEGVVCQMDDVLVFGKNQPEHDSRLTEVLERIENAGATLNPDKCEFRKNKLKFLGHVIDDKGITADPDKTSAIREMRTPTNVSELRRFMGMVNQMGKFSAKLATLTQPLRELLSKKNAWLWGATQDHAFDQVKAELSKPTTLALYDPAADSKVSADASSYGLGAVLLQKTNDDWRPVAFASRAMSETERRYAQIEKEALALTWACEKFSMYLLGKKFQVETDHKPLVPLLGSRHLDTLPPRVLRFRLRLARFDYAITHIPGKHLYTADTLSRAPTSTSRDSNLEELAELAMDACVAHLPAGPERLQEYEQAQNSDPLCSMIITYCRTGWPSKTKLNEVTMPYWEARGNFTLHGNLLLHNTRIVIPASKQRETLEKIHNGHQGIQRCRLRAKMSVWWPGMSGQIEEFVNTCPHCVKTTTLPKEPLMPTPLPDYPWQRIGSDLFLLDGKNYLIVVDYFSRYPEIVELPSTSSPRVISAMKSLFARHGIPEVVVSDNGPQFSSHEFSEFARMYNFTHQTSSPHFPQSNGQAERGVKTVKKLLKDAEDPQLALLSYRATPLPWCKLSPAELLMGRIIRSNIPQISETFVPQWSYLADFRKSNEQYKLRQKTDYDSRHRTRPLPEIPDNTVVWVTTNDQCSPGRIVSPADAPRSYIVETPSGQIRRNRAHLTPLPSAQLTAPTNSNESAPPANRSPIQTRSRTGTTITAPDRL